jgi:hypothetical protein
MTRPAPKGLASWTAREPTPPAAAITTTVSPDASRADVLYKCQAVSPCNRRARATPSETPSGMSATDAAGATAYSAYPPVPTSAATRVPSAMSPAPRSTTPATSAPGMSGSS